MTRSTSYCGSQVIEFCIKYNEWWNLCVVTQWVTVWRTCDSLCSHHHICDSLYSPNHKFYSQITHNECVIEISFWCEWGGVKMVEANNKHVFHTNTCFRQTHVYNIYIYDWVIIRVTTNNNMCYENIDRLVLLGLDPNQKSSIFEMLTLGQLRI